MEQDIKHYKALKNKLINEINRNFKDKIIINSFDDNNRSLPNILNISFSAQVKTDPETMLIKLDLEGIAVSSGSACTSGTVQPSHVLKAIGYDDEAAKTSLRISFGRFNKDEDADYFIKVLKEIIN